MGHFMPNFGLFILAIVFFMLSSAKDEHSELKCSLANGNEYSEYLCQDKDFTGTFRSDDWCFLTRCNMDSTFIAKGCASTQKDAAKVATTQCGAVGEKFDKTLTEEIKMCRENMCNGPKLKCSLPNGGEYKCDEVRPDDVDPVRPDVDADGDECCCFSTRCSPFSNLTAKGCAKDQDQAGKVAIAQCNLANVKFDVPKEDIMLCRGDMCNGWYPWAKVPINKAEEQTKFFGIAQSMLQASSTSAPAGNGQGGLPSENGQGGLPSENGQQGSPSENANPPAVVDNDEREKSAED